MRHASRALTVLYFLASAGLLRCALISQQNGSTAYCAFFAGAAVLFGLAAVHHTWHREQLHAALVRLERASRPIDQRPALDGTVALELAVACCEPAKAGTSPVRYTASTITDTALEALYARLEATEATVDSTEQPKERTTP
ncbi:hypothetical protein [Streptomyces sp. NPDC087317]|uniref:hypothetical protein n=1 Tax=Streptomyces sp. NPDC087317 TaxID=3365784 RepID=UPI003814A83C